MPHIHELIDFTVEVFVVCNSKVLLRMHDKYGIWLSIGGHVELNEDPNQAALREVKEEVGLDVVLYDPRLSQHSSGVQELIPPLALYRHSISEAHEHVSFVYFARASSDIVTPERASDEWRWCSKQDLETMDLRKDIRARSIAALAALGSTTP